ncbi:redoxin domain-containing protein [Ralstonia sp. GX3-BWBA]|uniref:redoxin domain-containing protein n=1 Tax=Ralstonia sp. GX3-BWBA TaxID=2219865 RepID=UPI000DD4316C|nr:redoxin domain-containing protein [Ralstonia sp. GX3-BWBA]
MNIRWKSFAMGVVLSATAFTATFAAQAAGALQFQPLRARDVPALLQTPHARPLIVEIWSLECSYCRENIARIAQWRRTAKQDVDVVMVSMDGPDQAEMLNRALAPLARDGKIGITRVPQYANAEDMPERLRAALDPGWQGEMPRTIILRPDGKRHASSGLLTLQALDTALRD